MTDVSLITGDLVAAQRAKLGLSREKFAQLVDMRPGAVWRLEMRGTFKPGEREHLVSVGDRWLVEVPTTGAQRTSRTLTARQPLSTTKLPSSPVAKPQCDISDEDEDLIQWLDVGKPDFQKRVELVFPQHTVSPTTLSESDGARRVSNSEVQTFKRCRRKWWLSYVRGFRPATERPYGARATGTRGHAALAAWYHCDNNRNRTDPRDALEIIVDLERQQLESSENFTPETLVKFNKDVELERVVIAGYMDWLSETGADAEYTVVGSEQYLEADLPEVANTRIIARLDARVVRKYDGARLFIDHKFVASIPGAVQLLPLNEQMQWYILLEQLQPNADASQVVGGALYNMLRRCKHGATAKPPFYQRVEVHHSAVNITSFRQRLVGTLDDMKYCRDEVTASSQPHQLVVYPTPTRDCAWDCPFIRICSMFDDGSRVEDALLDHYVVGDPYAYYENSLERSDDRQ